MTYDEAKVEVLDKLLALKLCRICGAVPLIGKHELSADWDVHCPNRYDDQHDMNPRFPHSCFCADLFMAIDSWNKAHPLVMA